VKKSTKIQLEAKVYGDDDTELFFTGNGPSSIYGDEKVVRSDGSDFFSAPGVETVLAAGVGDAMVSIETGRARALAHFRVVE
jgi:hypothetical protein